MNDSIVFGSAEIAYRLVYADRKSLGITVTPDLDVLVKAPTGVSPEQVRERVLRKAPWIIRQQHFFLGFHPRTPARRYVSGETHLYLGRQYQLRVVQGESTGVRFTGHWIEATTPDKALVPELLRSWYRARASEKIPVLAEPLIRRFDRYGVAPSELILREMPARWGSCTAQGKILLNPELIKAPRGCIEYVILHELCHLVHHNHTRAFFDLQAREMPAWETWKMKLERLMA